MKLQSYIKLDSLAGRGRIALINFAIDSSSFLPREFLPTHHFTNKTFPKLIAAIILPTNLNIKNTIDLDANGEPVLTAGREFPFLNSDPLDLAYHWHSLVSRNFTPESWSREFGKGLDFISELWIWR